MERPKLATTINETLNEGRLNAVLWAGVAWLIVAMLGGLVSGLFVISIVGIPLALVLGALFVGLPLWFISGMWGWRSPIAAWVAAAYSLLWAAGGVGGVIYNSAPIGLVAVLVVATPGILSVMAANDLRREARERLALARTISS